MLAQRGYIVASVDNRGTGARGRAWRKLIYRADGCGGDAGSGGGGAGRRPVLVRRLDADRDLGLELRRVHDAQHDHAGPDVYRMGIAVAPVTHWKYYDTIYTERYNGLPQDNAAGTTRAHRSRTRKNLKGRLLIVHGSGDDNVHFQNTEAMVNALVAANRPFSLMVYPNRTPLDFGWDHAAASVHTASRSFVEENRRRRPAARRGRRCPSVCAAALASSAPRVSRTDLLR